MYQILTSSLSYYGTVLGPLVPPEAAKFTCNKEGCKPRRRGNCATNREKRTLAFPSAPPSAGVEFGLSVFFIWRSLVCTIMSKAQNLNSYVGSPDPARTLCTIRFLCETRSNTDTHAYTIHCFYYSLNVVNRCLSGDGGPHPSLPSIIAKILDAAAPGNKTMPSRVQSLSS